MIFETLSSDTNSSEASTRAHSATFSVNGTWDGATVKLQFKHRSSSTWYDVSSASWTDDTTGVVDVSPAWDLRFNMSSSGTTSVECGLDRRAY